MIPSYMKQKIKGVKYGKSHFRRRFHKRSENMGLNEKIRFGFGLIHLYGRRFI